MKPTGRLGLSTVGLLPAVFLVFSVVRAEELSHARIVRLSFAEGTVTVQRPDGPDWAAAPVNTPIQEGFKLSTAEGGFAEVEFENASTARLGQLSLLEFTQLALLPSGGKVSRLNLQMGYATFHLMPEGEDVYEVQVAGATLTPRGKTMFRADLDEGVIRIEVFKGSVEISSAHGSGVLTKNAVVTLRPGADQEAYQVVKGITKDSWDEWVEQREEQPTVALSRAGPGYQPAGSSWPMYGWNDLSYWGSWSFFPGYGYGWAPSVSSGWVPYSRGRWCWYPDFGYTWISAEAWGWLPYHYGQWAYQPGYGWFWVPGAFGSWSPALVDWYMGPGWIGWAPQCGRNCSRPAGGGTTTVPPGTVQNGNPVAPGTTVGADPSHGRRIPHPDVDPTRWGRLPGPVVTDAGRFRGRENAEEREHFSGGRQVVGSGRNAVSVGGPEASREPTSNARGVRGREGVEPEAGIVFDPNGRRFVNNPSTGAPSPSDRPQFERHSAPGRDASSGPPGAKTADLAPAEPKAAGDLPLDEPSALSGFGPRPGPAEVGPTMGPRDGGSRSEGRGGGGFNRQSGPSFSTPSPRSGRNAPSSSGARSGSSASPRSSSGPSSGSASSSRSSSGGGGGGGGARVGGGGGGGSTGGGSGGGSRPSSGGKPR